ncbi:MAG: zf-HC2 domain-containing protein [Acidobacteria bacterium]|nr:zf-HC2 domain-containing protein [Acidobacteriota bacterium]
MKCQECEPLIEEYLDGELDRRAAEGVRAHLAACAACAEARDAIVAEGALYAAYEREVEVTPELWGGIEARIGAGRRVEREMGLLQRISGWLAPLLTAPRFSPALTGALVVLAVLATVGAMSFRDARTGGNDGDTAKQNDGARPEAGSAPVVNPPANPSGPAPGGSGPTPDGRDAPGRSGDQGRAHGRPARARGREAVSGGHQNS